MSATDRASRMLTLVPWLLERQGASLAEAADAFGVDEDTIRTDLSHLDFCGLPGLGGGALFEIHYFGDRVVVRMADELRRPLRLTPTEALSLVLRLSTVEAALGGEIPALAGALAKVRAALGIGDDVAAQVGELDSTWLAPLRSALSEGRQVRLTYRGRKDEVPRPRTVDPWRLYVAEGTWYLQGRDVDADELRTYRLDRVADVVVTAAERGSEPPEQPPPPPRYEPAEDDLRIEVLLGPSARWIVDAVTPEKQEEAGEGRLRVIFATDAPRWAARLLLAAGEGLLSVEPSAFAARVRREAEEALENARTVA